VRAAEDRADEQARHPQVLGVGGLARDLLRRVELGQAPADDAKRLGRLDERFVIYGDTTGIADRLSTRYPLSATSSSRK